MRVQKLSWTRLIWSAGACVGLTGTTFMSQRNGETEDWASVRFLQNTWVNIFQNMKNIRLANAKKKQKRPAFMFWISVPTLAAATDFWGSWHSTAVPAELIAQRGCSNNSLPRGKTLVSSGLRAPWGLNLVPWSNGRHRCVEKCKALLQDSVGPLC